MKKKLRLNVLVKQEDDLQIAHCLELDIVSTGKSKKEAMDDMVDLITAQIHYAIDNDNLDHLFKIAPAHICEQYLNQ